MFSDWSQAVPFAKPASIKDTECVLCGAQAPEEDRQIQVHNSFPVPTGQRLYQQNAYLSSIPCMRLSWFGSEQH